MRWCTVTVTDPDGRRRSVDVQATSTFDAAHLFVVDAKSVALYFLMVDVSLGWFKRILNLFGTFLGYFPLIILGTLLSG
jgi:hypothetical protein